MKGRIGTPTALKVLKGTHPYRINKNEPKPRSVSGVLPKAWAPQMSAAAKGFWRQYAPMLSKLGVLTEADLPALRVLAELFAKWARLTSRINKARALEPNEEMKYLRILTQVEAKMLDYLGHFGMTASSRGRITMGGDSEDDGGFLD